VIKYIITVDGIELRASIIPNVRFGEIDGTPVRVEKFRRGFYRWCVRHTGPDQHTGIYGRGATCTEALRNAKSFLSANKSAPHTESLTADGSAENDTRL
jgi:hypothetical protein